MELKVWVEGIQRIVCGVTDKTTCQDVVYALAHATGKTGRFTLIERWRNNERLLAPQEHPLKVIQKWGEYSQDVQFILQRSALDGKSSGNAPLSPHSQRAASGKNSGKFPGNKTQASDPPGAVWKPPPSNFGHLSSRKPDGVAARLSPDSGRGSDKTGSDTSNSYPDSGMPSRNHNGNNNSNGMNSHNGVMPRSASASQMPWSQQQQPSAYESGSGYPGFSGKMQSMPALRPPAYRPPPPMMNGRNPSPADPPPYREPPAPENHSRNSRNPERGVSPDYQRFPVRHYSPPPTQRTPHLSRHPSRSSLVSGSSRYPAHGLPYRPPQKQQQINFHGQSYKGLPPSDYSELVNLVSAQQTTIHSQHAEIKQCESETNYLEGQVGLPGQQQHQQHQQQQQYLQQPEGFQQQPQPGSQLELVLVEVHRLEDAAMRNEEELRQLTVEQDPDPDPDPGIRSEIMQLKQRLAGTDQELQKTNHTLRRLGDEMRSMSLEKSRQREVELAQEVERLQAEIKNLQKNSEEAANVNQQLSKEVKDVEEQINERKADLEKLIQEMREVNMESLAISPPEESKQFLDGPPKQSGTVRKMMGSPRQLENAVPTSKNPHGVWV